MPPKSPTAAGRELTLSRRSLQKLEASALLRCPAPSLTANHAKLLQLRGVAGNPSSAPVCSAQLRLCPHSVLLAGHRPEPPGSTGRHRAARPLSPAPAQGALGRTRGCVLQPQDATQGKEEYCSRSYSTSGDVTAKLAVIYNLCPFARGSGSRSFVRSVVCAPTGPADCLHLPSRPLLPAAPDSSSWADFSAFASTSVRPPEPGLRCDGSRQPPSCPGRR